MSVRVSIDAEPLAALTRNDYDGTRMVRMGETSYIHISPEVARQWIGVLETIAEEESK